MKFLLALALLQLSTATFAAEATPVFSLASDKTTASLRHQHILTANKQWPTPTAATANKSNQQQSLQQQQDFYSLFITVLVATVLLLLFTLLLRLRLKVRSQQQLPHRDRLTGLACAESVWARVEHRLALSDRYGYPLCVALLDLDNLAQLNKTFGYDKGDEVIKCFAQLLKTQLRNTDIVGRYSNELFMVGFPFTSSNEAHSVLKETLQAWQQHQLTNTLADFPLSFSAGLAQASSHSTLTELVKSTHQLLYRAKVSGRSQIKRDSDPLSANANTPPALKPTASAAVSLPCQAADTVC